MENFIFFAFSAALLCGQSFGGNDDLWRTAIEDDGFSFTQKNKRPVPPSEFLWKTPLRMQAAHLPVINQSDSSARNGSMGANFDEHTNLLEQQSASVFPNLILQPPMVREQASAPNIPQNQNAVHPEAKRKPFKKEEDARLKSLVPENGKADWARIAAQMPERSARQCRERYKNYLRPDIINGPWTQQEDALLMEKYVEMGSQWARMEEFFPGRSNINIKNRYLFLQRESARRQQLQIQNPVPDQQAQARLSVPANAMPVSLIQDNTNTVTVGSNPPVAERALDQQSADSNLVQMPSVGIRNFPGDNSADWVFETWDGNSMFSIGTVDVGFVTLEDQDWNNENLIENDWPFPIEPIDENQIKEVVDFPPDFFFIPDPAFDFNGGLGFGHF